MTFTESTAGPSDSDAAGSSSSSSACAASILDRLISQKHSDLASKRKIGATVRPTPVARVARATLRHRSTASVSVSPTCPRSELDTTR